MMRRRPSPEELAAKYAPAPDTEHADRTTAEFHAATDRTGLPQPPRHRGVTLPDNAPDAWELE